MLFYEISAGMRGTLFRGQRQLWVECFTRKLFQCRQCGRPIPAKSRAWRPLTNKDNRMWRVHPHCMTIRDHQSQGPKVSVEPGAGT